MRAFFLLCITAAFTAVVMGDNCPSCNELSPEMKERLQKNGQTMNRLIARMLAVSDTVAKRKQDREQAETQAHNMLQRIERHNGICPDKFVCGGAAGQCVDNLVVCDGDDDCDNGADEADNICTNPGSPGSTFEGVTVWDQCTRRQPYKVAVDFISEERRSPKSNLYVNARIRMSYSHRGMSGEDNLPLKGIYHHGRRQMEFKSPEDDRLGVDIEFPPGENDVLIAYTVREASNERCAKFLLKRQ